MTDAEAILVRDTDRTLAAVEPDGFMQMLERVAANKDVDVAKLEKLIELQERIMRHNAKAAFNAAFSRMQPALPVISEKGQIVVKGTLRSTYAKLEDIQAAIKPVLKEFGFAIRHRTEWPADKPNIIRIVGILTHEQGHSEESVFEAKADQSDFRTDIQSGGSTISFGRRYTTLDVLNIETRGSDDDGHKSGRPQPPDEYDEWMLKMSATADKGIIALEQLFTESDVKLRNYLLGYDAINFAKMRTRARTGRPATS